MEDTCVDCDTIIHLYQKNGEWRAYEKSAYILFKHLPAILIRKSKKRDVVIAIVPFEDVLNCFHSQIDLITNDYIGICIKREVEDKINFPLWKRSLTTD